MSLSLKKFGKRSRRWRFYVRNALMHSLPDAWFRRRLPGLLAEADARLAVDAQWRERLDACCKQQAPFELDNACVAIGDLPTDGSRSYYYDFRDVVRFFPAHLRVRYLFGDVMHVPEQVTLLKSRPIGNDNQNSILLRLNQMRHFVFSSRDRAFARKQDGAVWRGLSLPHHEQRQALVRAYHDHPCCNVGDVGSASRGQPWHKSFMTRAEQLRYKCVISLEGNDVATNLKWIMSSQSLCLMPRPRFETWFLESRLQAGLHYVQLQDDLADLPEKITWYCAHPEAAQRIIDAANAYAAPFRDRRAERLLSLLVLRRFFQLSGQWDR